MSQVETSMTRRFGERVGGAAGRVPNRGSAARWRHCQGSYPQLNRRFGSAIPLDGHDLVVVQTKAHRLGMNLLGQALFSRLLIEDRFAPRSIRAVALCTADDAVLRPIPKRFDIEVIVDDLARAGPTSKSPVLTRGR